jgi:hypothetical protein
MTARVTRIMAPGPKLPVLWWCGVCCAATLIVIVPIALLVLPN